MYRPCRTADGDALKPVWWLLQTDTMTDVQNLRIIIQMTSGMHAPASVCLSVCVSVRVRVCLRPVTNAAFVCCLSTACPTRLVFRSRTARCEPTGTESQVVVVVLSDSRLSMRYYQLVTYNVHVIV